MKILGISILIILSNTKLNAVCNWMGLSVFPTSNTVNENAIFVIDGFAESQTIITQLNKRYPIYLIGEKQKIKLKVKEVLVGDFQLTQAVLIPETKLKLGANYHLIIANLPKHESLERWNKDSQKYEPAVYKVVKGMDTISPIFSSTPKEIDKKILYYGCGPAIKVIFDCNVIDSSKYLIRTTVKCIQTGKMTSYYLQADEGKIEVGKEMCSGAFLFYDGENYEIEFSIMDSSGNLFPWKSERIKFTRPTDANSNENYQKCSPYIPNLLSTT